MKLFKKKEFDLLNEKIQEVTEKEDFIEFLIKSLLLPPENYLLKTLKKLVIPNIKNIITQ